MKIGNKRLLKLADILDKIPARAKAKDGDPLFYMATYAHTCGSPACALGWWASKNPSRWEMPRGYPALKGFEKLSAFEAAAMDFEIGYHEAATLFESHGCGNAKTGKQAAKYIRKFVEKRAANSSDPQRTKEQ